MSETALPDGWSMASIGQICALNERPSSLLCADPTMLVDFVPMAAVSEEFGGPPMLHSRPAQEVAKGYVSFVEGDVLFAKITPCMENGKVALVPRLRAGVGFGSTEFHVLRSQGLVEPAWLAHFLSQRAFRRLARQNMTGSAGQLRVPIRWLATQQVPLPPLSEQRRILGRVDELVADLRAAEGELMQAKRKLALYRQSLLKSAVEGALTAEWRESTGAHDWRVVPAESVCGFITKGTTPPKALQDADARTVPFVRVTNLTDTGALNFSDQVFVSEAIHRGFLARSIVQPSDVLMNIVGPPLGQVSLVPDTHPEWNVNQAIAIFRAQAGLLPEFLKTVLLSPPTVQWLKARAKTTAGQTNLTLELCRAIPLPMPSPEEQAEIVRVVDSQLDAVFAQSAAIERSLAQVTAQRENILRAAFSGQLLPLGTCREPKRRAPAPA